MVFKFPLSLCKGASTCTGDIVRNNAVITCGSKSRYVNAAVCNFAHEGWIEVVSMLVREVKKCACTWSKRVDTHCTSSVTNMLTWIQHVCSGTDITAFMCLDLLLEVLTALSPTIFLTRMHPNPSQYNLDIYVVCICGILYSWYMDMKYK